MADDGSNSSAGNAVNLRETVYAHLRAVAQHKLAHERPGHTLQATALVNEAFLRIERGGTKVDPSSEQFVWAAVEAMRRILIEHARARNAIKRGGEVRRVDWNDAIADVADLANASQSEKIEALDAAIVRLEDVDERAARVVKLRFYGGMTIEAVATALEISPRTAKRDWEYARVWLLRELSA